ncbi:MAG: hypothetical protein VKL39_16415 [Leptolyngbyaceae bacterium]|nr:hypothetical protein [Leptolyngbyaceae bacterium]
MTPQELKQWREDLNMSQVEFSQWIKPTRTPGIISQWEVGAKKIPEWLDTLKELRDIKKS